MWGQHSGLRMGRQGDREPGEAGQEEAWVATGTAVLLGQVRDLLEGLFLNMGGGKDGGNDQGQDTGYQSQEESEEDDEEEDDLDQIVE